MSDKKLRIALVAHDAKKDNLIEWVGVHREALSKAQLFGTGTTGKRILDNFPELDMTPLFSGPLGGDQQIGAMIAEKKLEALVFFIDPMSPMPHDVDVKALTRLATVYDLPMANSPSTANFVIQGLTRPD
ncbi:methylglyoxal synthase [Cohaesibacter gelatinilyticus]|uniref:Methylglyoxal synthase n=1 Tax=Cohaesibacter gelatinilyticus TaxID=372072 RepID=A0A285PHJ1_9HYPH|nr:methylglyoxal synthase [Cohaesibacter gelatinilyticus]SNZ20743.1 methylglyoxal synthase [Cohaesibacter gelatinilyticus]HAT87737.1 methylglyoxal synthase [Hyphomicrobiales bacterium]